MPLANTSTQKTFALTLLATVAAGAAAYVLYQNPPRKKKTLTEAQVISAYVPKNMNAELSDGVKKDIRRMADWSAQCTFVTKGKGMEIVSKNNVTMIDLDDLAQKASLLEDHYYKRCFEGILALYNAGWMPYKQGEQTHVPYLALASDYLRVFFLHAPLKILAQMGLGHLGNTRAWLDPDSRFMDPSTLNENLLQLAEQAKKEGLAFILPIHPHEDKIHIRNDAIVVPHTPKNSHTQHNTFNYFFDDAFVQRTKELQEDLTSNNESFSKRYCEDILGPDAPDMMTDPNLCKKMAVQGGHHARLIRVTCTTTHQPQEPVCFLENKESERSAVNQGDNLAGYTVSIIAADTTQTTRRFPSFAPLKRSLSLNDADLQTWLPPEHTTPSTKADPTSTSPTDEVSVQVQSPRPAVGSFGSFSIIIGLFNGRGSSPYNETPTTQPHTGLQLLF